MDSIVSTNFDRSEMFIDWNYMKRKFHLKQKRRRKQWWHSISGFFWVNFLLSFLLQINASFIAPILFQGTQNCEAKWSRIYFKEFVTRNLKQSDYVTVEYVAHKEYQSGNVADTHLQKRWWIFVKELKPEIVHILWLRWN